jgi:gamma-glutamylcyclotransferase (GGCT)/AIG2-like uncharacterized protein YtfP
MQGSIVFVYGTLLRGMSRATVMEKSRFLGLGEIQGDLFDLGTYPGVVDGKGRVVGELYEVDSATLDVLDQIEGFNPDEPEFSLYLRASRQATFLNDGRRETVSVYLYNHEVASRDPIKHGDYRRFIELHENNETYYIAYGSNLNQSRLEDRIGSVRVLTRGTIDGFELCFNKGNVDGSSYANIKAGQPGARLPFVAYLLPEGLSQIVMLDGYEGAPNTYRRLAFPFPLEGSNDQQLGFIYVAAPHLIEEGLMPREAYLAHIRRGYQNHGFTWSEPT